MRDEKLARPNPMSKLNRWRMPMRMTATTSSTVYARPGYLASVGQHRHGRFSHLGAALDAGYACVSGTRHD